MINRYLITTLYVIAGCTVISPVGLQENCEVARLNYRDANITIVLRSVVEAAEEIDRAEKNDIFNSNLDTNHLNERVAKSFVAINISPNLYLNYKSSNNIRAPGGLRGS